MSHANSMKFWKPQPGEEVYIRFETTQWAPLVPAKEGNSIPCASARTFETSLKCFGCAGEAGTFVAALLTFFLNGADAAKVYYQSKRG